MKTDIHPTYVDAQVVCACGNTFTTRSTKTNIRTDLCNVCHPFYTGEQRIVDTAGQVERFMKRMQSAADSNAGPSKRQARLTTRQEKEAADRRRAEEAEAAATAARSERRKAQQEHEAALAAQQAAAAAVLSGETDDLKALVPTEVESEHPVAAGAE